MATSGTLNTNNYQGRFLSLNWWQTGQNIASNYTNIHWELKGAGSASASWYLTAPVEVVINGQRVYYTENRFRLYDGTLVASGNLSIYHNNVGEKWFDISVKGAIYTYAINCTGFSSFQLNTIPRQATIYSAYDFNDEANPTITYNNPGGFRLNARLEFAGVQISRNNIPNTGSYTFYLTDAERNLLRQKCTGQSMSVRQTIATCLSGDAESFWSWADKTMVMINANPTIQSVDYKDTNESTIYLTNNNKSIIRNKSLCRITCKDIKAYKFANITSIEAIINGTSKFFSGVSGNVINEINLDFGTINIANDIDAKIIIKDSRGYRIEKDLPIDIIDYNSPYATISCQRENNFYTRTNLKVDASFTNINDSNYINIEYQYKKHEENSWSNLISLFNNQVETINLDNNYQWDLKVIIKDYFNESIIYNYFIDRGIPIAFFDSFLNSVGFNCFPESKKGLYSDGLQIDDKIYIGSQVLFNDYEDNGAGDIDLVWADNYRLIDGVFKDINIPDRYEKAYKLTAQISTGGDNLVNVKLNNISSDPVNTPFRSKFRAISSSRIFKETELTLQNVDGSSEKGLILKAYSSQNIQHYINNVTIHGYLVKKDLQ